MVIPRFDALAFGFYRRVDVPVDGPIEGETVSSTNVEVLFIDPSDNPTVPVDESGEPLTSLSLFESWAIAQGMYLFLPALPTDLGMLRSQLTELRRNPAYTQARFLWVHNADESLSQWQMQSLSVERETEDDLGRGHLSRLAVFDLSGYALSLPRDADFVLDESESGFLVKTQRAYVTTDYGTHRLDEVGEEIRLPLAGENIGCWQFALTLLLPGESNDDAAEDTHYDELAALDIGFRVFFIDPLFSSDPSLFGSGVFYQSLRYPLLDESAAKRFGENVTLQGCWDSLASDRSFFTFTPLPNDDGFVALPSGYRSNLGYTVYLRPRAESRLVFATKPADSLGSAEGLYLVPQNEFDLSIPTHKDNSRGHQPDHGKTLMCGLSGVEYIKLLDEGTYTLGFVPAQPAFAPRYTPSEGLTRRLRDLVSGFVGRPASTLSPLELLINLFGEIRAVRIEEIRDVLLGEFFSQDFQIPAEPLEDFKQLGSSELSSLGDFERWSQALLRASRARDDSGAQQAAVEPAMINPERTSPEPALTSPAVSTAWAYVRRSEELATYYAQPDQSILYKPSDQADLFSFLEVPTTDLPVSRTLPGLFPVFPYGSLTAGLTDCRELELQVVNPLRRAQIRQHYEQSPTRLSANNAVRAANNNTTAALLGEPATRSITNFDSAADPASSGTTPQGLLARFTSDFSIMKALILARSTKRGNDQFMEFTDIEKGSELWSAFQSNQLLLVVDDADSLQAYFDDPDNVADSQSKTQLTISEWTFQFDVSEWRDDSILIFKYHNKSLLDLIEQPSVWSQAATFVGDENKITDVRQRLRKVLEDAIALDTPNTPPKTRKRYAPLANIARNPNWSGILGINIPVPLDGNSLPDALAALAGGINKPFFAKYVGVNDTPVRTNPQKVLEAELSSLFGLIDYEDNAAPPANPSGYNFQVLSLRVLFENSRETDFASEIAVTLDKLFGERTQLQEDGDIPEFALVPIRIEAVSDLPTTGRRQVIIAKSSTVLNPDDAYHIRIFDAESEQIIDLGEGQFLPDESMLRQLDTLFPDTGSPPFLDTNSKRTLLQNLTLTLGNNRSGRNIIKLQGSSENHNGKPTYAFSFSGDNRFLMPNSAIFNYIDIVKAQFSSAPIPPGDNPTITGRFSFWFQLGFRQLEKFDAFSFGPSAEFPTKDDIKHQRFLSASNLVVTLSFPQKSKDERTFAFVPDDITFQPRKPNKKLAENSFRPTSLYAKFPVTLKGFIQGQDKPKGVLDVKTALGNASVAGVSWYGLSFEIDLGSLGALSSITKLVAELVVLWIPNTDPTSNTRPDPQVYMGMKLPGLSGDVLGFPLQSVIKFSFKTAEFLFDPADGPEKATYLLKLKAIVLKLLVLSLPPNGQTELLIFGNSAGRDQPIGWYAAYAKEPAKKPP
ncbi:MAG: hypothetical protein AAGN15_05430 [Cyanobacteria bacterium J06581_3]